MQPCLSNYTIPRVVQLKTIVLYCRRNARFPVHTSPPRKFSEFAACLLIRPGMPYGLKTAPETFQRILKSIFSDFLHDWLIIYIDDLIVRSDNEMAALQLYDKVLQYAAQFSIQFKPTKCVFFHRIYRI